MSVLRTEDITVNWGGPNAPHASAAGEVMFYFDISFGYMMIQRNIKSRSGIDSETLAEIRACAEELSVIVEEIVLAGFAQSKG